MAGKIACGSSKLTLFLGNSATVIIPINKIRKFGPLKDCEGLQKYDIKGPNDPWQFWLILTPAYIVTESSLF